MRARRRPSLSALAAILALCMPAGAETVSLRPAGDLVEELTERPRTVGLLLAGLHLGAARGSFRPDDIRLVVPEQLRGRPICLRLASRDGRYRALVPYVVAPDAIALPRLDFPSEHARQLARISAEDVAARIIASAHCDEGATGQVVAATIRGSEPRAGAPGSLTVLVNASDARVSVLLADGAGAPLSSVSPCAPIREGVTVVFTLRCNLPLPAAFPGGEAQLHLLIVDLTEGRSRRSFPVLLPPAAGQ
jgi:hypothetical protein